MHSSKDETKICLISSVSCVIFENEFRSAFENVIEHSVISNFMATIVARGHTHAHWLIIFSILIRTLYFFSHCHRDRHRHRCSMFRIMWDDSSRPQLLIGFFSPSLTVSLWNLTTHQYEGPKHSHLHFDSTTYYYYLCRVCVCEFGNFCEFRRSSQWYTIIIYIASASCIYAHHLWFLSLSPFSFIFHSRPTRLPGTVWACAVRVCAPPLIFTMTNKSRDLAQNCNTSKTTSTRTKQT